MLHLFIGENNAVKKDQIDRLKTQWLTDPQALRFDYDILYGHKLDPKEFKKSLLALPAILSQRLILIHDAEKLNEHCKTILGDFIKAGSSHAVLILDCDSVSDKDAFWNEVKRHAKVFESRPGAKDNVFDMSRAIGRGRCDEALKTLDALFDAGNHPLQIMGGLVWWWGSEKARMPRERFEKGLRELQCADLNIKRSRLKPEQALEVLVVKLAELKK